MARRLARRCGYPEAPHHFDVTAHFDKFDTPKRWKKPRRVFVCSMSDLFHEHLPTEVILMLLETMRDCPQHTFQILTKRPFRMQSVLAEWSIGSGPLANVWVGVTAENQEQADTRIPMLLQTPAALRFVSVEPMLGEIDLDGYIGTEIQLSDYDFDYGDGVDWVICGGETGNGARPMRPGWVRGLRDQCVDAGVPFFFKSWGEWGEVRMLKRRVVEKFERGVSTYSNGDLMFRVGKKWTGWKIDGKVWRQFPGEECAG
jgi:protein gp37